MGEQRRDQLLRGSLRGASEVPSNERQGLLACCDLAFELGVFRGFEHGFKFGAWAITGGDEVVAGEEEFGGDGFGGG